MGSISTIIQSDNQTLVAQAEVNAKRKMQQSSNLLSAKGNTLNEFMRTLGNMSRMEAAGKEYNNAIESLAWETQEGGRASLTAQLEQAEALGALDAMASVSGVGGSSMDLMESMIGLKADTQMFEAQETMRRLGAQGRKGTANILVNGIKAMDSRQQMGTFSYQEFIDPKKMSNKWLKVAGVAVATYFGGPQAGEAAASHAVADWKANNGDFDGSARDYGAALKGAMSSYKDWSERGGTSWGSDVAKGWQIGGGTSSSSSSKFTKSGTSNTSKSSGSNSKSGGGYGWGW
ncbi:internal virion protein [Xanthomonas phage SB3]|uniref:Internal virion protein n=1 Tax=Xanthomonas phage SB3 TaxID=3117472 RepID=A0ABZ2GZB8_9CAUD